MDRRLAAYIDLLPSGSAEQANVFRAVDVWPGRSFWEQMRKTGLVARGSALLVMYTGETVLLLASWACLGSGALSGRLDEGWLAAWALCMAGAIPLRASTRWLEGVVAVGLGGLLKQRLMAGAITMDSDLMRGKGLGHLLSEILETEAIEQLGASGGMQIILAAIELVIAPFVLALGAAGVAQVVFLISWISIAAVLICRNVQRRHAWTAMRFQLTRHLVESISAHRTRLSQQSPAEWHLQEDEANEHYTRLSEKLDRSSTWIEAAVPRAYMLAAFLILAPSFLARTASMSQLAISFGAILFASGALEKLTAWLSPGVGAAIAWHNLKPIFNAAAQGDDEEYPERLCDSGDALLQAQNLVFHRPERREPVLKGCSLTIQRGDQILLQGTSGSGKSTLVALLGGLHCPSSGMILSGGLDRPTMGNSAWRRRFALAPQYQENHIFSAPLSLNLLLGRPYPHSDQDMDEAREVCYELGLGPLLERMPAGLDQIVGETGWQLSQGERGRVFLARALLQKADIVLLDESLGALDPQNLSQCLSCVIRRTKTLIVVAHP
jgi:ATP-binding cassette subfamily B protein